MFWFNSAIRPWLIEAKELLRIRSRRPYYSQFGEDVFIQTYFRGKKTKGFYIDVGANHPIRRSNTYLLYKHGWRGIAIEPDYVLWKLLSWVRPRDINLRCGIGAGGAKPFYRSADPRQSSFLKDVADQNMDRGIATIHSEVVPMRELRDIIKEYNVHELDVLSVDTEGGDLEALQTLDWNDVRPTLVLAEEHGFEWKRANTFPVYSFLGSNGYRLCCQLGYTLVFERER